MKRIITAGMALALASVPVGAVAQVLPLKSGAIDPGSLANGRSVGTAQEQAVGAVQADGGNASAAIVTATGATTARTNAARAADVVNVKDFGAVCNDAADDTTSINNALNHFRAVLAKTSARLVFPGGTCKTTGTINFTGIRIRGTVIDGAGTTIDAQFSGLPVIDAFNTRWLVVNDMAIITSRGAIPTIGYQMGLISNTIQADDNTLRGLFINGNFSVTGYYNRSSETSAFYSLRSWNSSATGYTMIMDGYNHWNPPSIFQKVVVAVDKADSFNENLFVNPDFRNSGGGPTMWLGFNPRHRYIAGYVGSAGPAPAITLFGEGGSFNFSQLDFDVHVESSHITNEFLLTGTTPAVTIDGLRLRDQGPQPYGSIFKLDKEITTASATNLDIELGSTKAVIFDNPTLWTVSGQYHFPSGYVAWNLPAAHFSGMGTIGHVTNFYGTFTGTVVDGAVAFVASGSVTSGSTQTMARNTDGMTLENTASVASQTVRLPPINGIAGQSAWISSDGGISSLTLQTASSTMITNSPTSIPAAGSRSMISDGTAWHARQ